MWIAHGNMMRPKTSDNRADHRGIDLRANRDADRALRPDGKHRYCGRQRAPMHKRRRSSGPRSQSPAHARIVRASGGGHHLQMRHRGSPCVSCGAKSDHRECGHDNRELVSLCAKRGSVLLGVVGRRCSQRAPRRLNPPRSLWRSTLGTIPSSRLDTPPMHPNPILERRESLGPRSSPWSHTPQALVSSRADCAASRRSACDTSARAASSSARRPPGRPSCGAHPAFLDDKHRAAVRRRPHRNQTASRVESLRGHHHVFGSRRSAKGSGPLDDHPPARRPPALADRNRCCRVAPGGKEGGQEDRSSRKTLALLHTTIASQASVAEVALDGDRSLYTALREIGGAAVSGGLDLVPRWVTQN